MRPKVESLGVLPFCVVSWYLQMRRDWQYAESMPFKEPRIPWRYLVVQFRHNILREIGRPDAWTKADYTLIISCISTCSCNVLWDCEPITMHISRYRQFRSSLILRETWRETCCIVLFHISWKYQEPGENSETRDEKNDWRDGLRNAIYTLLISLVLPTFFHILLNLTISV